MRAPSVLLRAGAAGLLASLTALGAPGCMEVPNNTDGRVGEAELAIQGGYVDEGDPNVVGIYDAAVGGICTGSLIAPNVVLTARHCVSNISNDSEGVICTESEAQNPHAASGFFVTTVSQLTEDPSNYHAVSEVIQTPGSDLLCGNDVAILILSENIAASEAVPLTPRVDYKLAEGEQYSAIGYGQSSDGNFGSAGVRRRRDELFVECAEDDCTGVASYVKDTEWIGDEGICSGDSGGPAFDLQGRVVGITSRGFQGCDDPVYGSTHSWGQFLKETVYYAAELGGYTAPLWVYGQPTDPWYNTPVGGDCVENNCSVCWNSECTRYCIDEVDSCPKGFECGAVEDGKICQRVEEEPPTGDDDGGSGDGADTAEDGCSVGGSDDPTNPVPWKPAVALGLIALALVRARGTTRRT